MNRRFSLAVLMVASLLAAWFLWEASVDPAAEGHVSATAAEDPAARESAEDLAQPEAATPSPARIEAAPGLASDATSAPAADDEAVPDSADLEPILAHVTGRLLTPGGAPAGGATLEIMGWGRNSEAIRKFGKPDDWKDVTGVAGPDGRFDLAFDPPRAYQFVLDASFEGHGDLSWRWSSLPPAEVTSVGDQTFPVAATVVGRVTDANGAPTGIAWMVYAETLGGARGAGADNSRVSGPADPATGEFRLEGVVPGKVELSAHSSAANWLKGTTLTVEAGAQAEANIVYSGPDLAHRITVTTFCRPFHVYNDPEEGDILAKSASGAEFVATKVKSSSQSHAIDDLPPGEYTVEIKTRYHRPWTQSGVSPGDVVRAHLIGSASLALHVTDAADGTPLESYGVRIRFREANFSPSVFDLHMEGKALPEGGLFEGLIPVPCTVVVYAEGKAPAILDLDTLTPGKVEHLDVALSAGGTLTGRVISSRGEGVEGATVLLHPHFPSYDPADVFSGPMGMGTRGAFEDAKRETVSDASGAFAFEGIPSGNFDVQVHSGQARVREDGLDFVGEQTREVKLTLPAQSSIEGRILGLRGAPPKELRVIAYPNAIRPKPFTDEGLATSRIGPDGSFRIDGLLSGPYEVALYLPSIFVKTSHSSSSGMPASYATLGQLEVVGPMSGVTFDATEVEPGTLTVTVLLNGSPASGARVSAETPQPTPERYDTAAITDSKGVAVLGPIFPGLYDLTAYPLDRNWRGSSASPVLLLAGENETFEFQLRTATGRMRVMHADLFEPMAETGVMIDGHRPFTTDAEGWLELNLTIGPHSVRGGDALFGTPLTHFVWGALGAEPAEVAVKF